jgi:hypothetical protein
MKKIYLTALAVFQILVLFGQPVEVQADYNSLGDCIFSAYNNSKVPVFLNIKFGDLQNTTFSEPVPYVKELSPGFNNLFTLLRYEGEDVPRFNYEIKVYRSNPLGEINFDFPYLIPLREGTDVKVFDVKEIKGFWGTEDLSSWTAVGFISNSGNDVFAARNGIIAEITGPQRQGDASLWYHTWTNTITVLQPDGTLICYHGVAASNKNLKVGDKIYAGQILGQVSSDDGKLVLMIYYQSLFSDDLKFIIPKFVLGEGDIDIVNSSKDYKVSHPYEIRAREMTRKEQRQILGKRK